MRVPCASVRRPPFFSTSATNSNLRQSQGCRVSRRNVANIRTAVGVENILRQKDTPVSLPFLFYPIYTFYQDTIDSAKVEQSRDFNFIFYYVLNKSCKHVVFENNSLFCVPIYIGYFSNEFFFLI